MLFLANEQSMYPIFVYRPKILFQMRELQHDNINPFLGACINVPNPCALYLYCPKGSLQVTL